MKKLISVVLSVIMMILIVTISSSAASSGDYSYTVISESEKTCKITAYSGKSKNAVVPATLNGYTVTALEPYTFYKDKALTVELPNTVSTLDATAFNALNSTVNYISVAENSPYFASVDGALFSKDLKTLVCYPAGKSDKSYSVPDGVNTIAYEAFYNAQFVTVKLPSSLKTIDRWAFEVCASLKEIKIPDGVTSIGASAFRNCRALESVYMPDSVTDVDVAAFYNCEALKEIRLSENITSISSSMFSGCESLTEIELPKNITSIGTQAFYHNDSLQKIVIPESVTDIYKDAFTSCKNVTIYGYENTYAEIFAGEKNIPFFVIKNEKTLTKDNNAGDVIINTDTLTETGESAESYTVSIPADTVIDWETEAKDLTYKVESHLGYNRTLAVTVTGNDFMIYSPETDVELKLAYTLTGDTNFISLTPVIYPMVDKTITVNVEKEAWANAVVGEYSDILTFTATIS